MTTKTAVADPGDDRNYFTASGPLLREWADAGDAGATAEVERRAAKREAKAGKASRPRQAKTNGARGGKARATKATAKAVPA